jgi:hypothetical protein
MGDGNNLLYSIIEKIHSVKLPFTKLNNIESSDLIFIVTSNIPFDKPMVMALGYVMPQVGMFYNDIIIIGHNGIAIINKDDYGFAINEKNTMGYTKDWKISIDNKRITKGASSLVIGGFTHGLSKISSIIKDKVKNIPNHFLIDKPQKPEPEPEPEQKPKRVEYTDIVDIGTTPRMDIGINPPAININHNFEVFKKLKKFNRGD